MSDTTKPKSSTLIIFLIGTFGIFLLDIGCILDWNKKLALNVDYLVNTLFHPLSSVISITCFLLIILLFMERTTPGRIEKLCNYLEEKKKIALTFIVISLISAVLLILNAILLLTETTAGTSNVGVLSIFHVLFGVLFGVSLMIVLLKKILNHYISDPNKWQKYAQIIILLVFLVLFVLVIVGLAVGWIIL